MKKMNRCARANRLPVFLLCAILLVSMVASFGALAAPKKSRNPKRRNENAEGLTVELSESLFNRLPSGATVEFTLYKIGDPAPDPATGWKFNADLTSYGNKIIAAKPESPALEEAVKELAKVVVKTDPYMSNGIPVTFTKGNLSQKTPELASGVYLGVLTKGPVGLTATPSLITVPTLDEKTRQWNSNFTINVKGAYTTPEPTATASPTPTTNPTTPPDDTPPGTPEEPGPTPEPTIDIPVKKVWDDGGNAAGKRPVSIRVTLTGGSTTQTVTLDESNGWSYTFTGLPELDADGDKIPYTITEEKVFGYNTDIEGDYTEGWTITNTYNVEPEYDSLEGDKSWLGNETLPTSVTLVLERDDGVTYTCTTNAGLGWHFRFDNVETVDKYGKKHTFTLKEKGVPGFFPQQIDDIKINGGRFIGQASIVNSPFSPTPPNSPTTPGGPTPNVPTRPEDIPDRKTGTPVPKFEDKTDEELEELFDIFGYGTPLYGILGTGDYIPVWVWVCAGVGIVAVILFIAMGRKKKNKK